MRAGLPEREPEFLKYWEENKIYEKKQELHAGHKKFVLHDGPPYANGKIHMGTALNKILKDIIMKYKYAQGFDTPYVPGWDTHGMPIEHAAIKNLGLNRHELDTLVLRKECHDYALKWIDEQRTDFKRLGVLGDWDHPYITMTHDYEAVQIHVFGEMAKKGYIYKGKKAVYWCPHCETALAEAEIEYGEEKSPAIFVKMPLVKDNGMLPEAAQGKPAYIVIWTTTPWTMPANVAIALHPDFEYAWVECEGEILFMAKEMLEAVGKVCKKDLSNIIGTCKGKDMEYAECRHPFETIDRKSLVVLADYVTLEAGTGCVHTAPGHGADDFETGVRYNLPIICPVDGSGKLTAEAGVDFAGMFVFDANVPIIKYLAGLNRLFGKENIRHQYAHCWRCKNPIIYRATEQWFASINDFRDKALKAVDDTTFYPAWGHDRLYNMIRDRQDWCISRQRSWGVPIPAFYCDDCGKYVITHETTQRVVDIVEKEGSDAWWKYSAEELLPEGFTCPHCGGHHFHKEKDIMDVWFDSGSTWNGVLKNPREEWKGAAYPCDLYLEGSDQHRGWFHSSLLTSVAVNGHAPYKAVLTHGFTMDGEGRKMSKSVGNVVAPQDIINKYGADVMRLWISSVEYQSDVRLSDKIIKSMSDVYRKIRNTFRYLLGNLADFNPATDAVPYAEMDELDRWALLRLEQVKEEVSNACEQYQFHVMYHAVHNFCTVDLSATYLDILKDRLYTETADSRLRRSAQTAMYEILDSLVRIMAPFICFTAEEVWQAMPAVEGKETSVHLADWPAMKPQYLDNALAEKWNARLALRSDVMKALENARADKVIGHPLDADVTIYAEGDAYETLKAMGDFLSDFFIVSNVELVNDTSAAPADALANEDGVRVSVVPSTRQKCERCWKHLDSVGSNPNHPDVCARCARVLDEE